MISDYQSLTFIHPSLQIDGKWLISDHHSSAMPEKPEAVAKAAAEKEMALAAMN